MIARLHIGVDISKRWFDACYFIGKEAKYLRFDNTTEGARDFIQSVRDLAKRHHVCMEHTGGYEQLLALACLEVGFTVSLVDGAKIAHFRKSFGSASASTDKKSSRLLAIFCKQRKPESWFPVPDEYRQLRELVRHRERLIESKTEWSCRAACVSESETVAQQREAIKEVLKLLIEKIQETILAQVQAHPNLKEQVALLDSIPNVAFVSAARILAETGPIEHYKSARDYALTAGLVPIVIHSGQKVPPGKLPTYGNRELRSAFFYPTLVSKRNKKGVGAFMDKVEKNGNKLKMTVVTAGMRKLAHIVYGVLKSGKAFDATKLSTKPEETEL